MKIKLTSALLFTVTVIAAGCVGMSSISDAKIAVEKPLPPPRPEEGPVVYAVEGDQPPGSEEAADALTSKLVDHVCYELLRKGMGASPERPGTRIARLQVLDSRDVGEWTRGAFGVFAGSDRMYVDVQVLTGTPPTEIALAHLQFAQSLSISTVNQHAMVDRIAKAAVKFLAGESND